MRYLLYALLSVLALLVASAVFVSTVLSQEAVINKYRNGGNAQSGEGDAVELLVVRDRLDLRSAALRDFATTPDGTLLTDSVTSGSGSYRFRAISFWQNLRAGTLIVLRFSTEGAQRQADTVITAGLNNSELFTASGNFNIAVRDMIMLKRSGEEIAGIGGSIHALAAGLTQAQTNGIRPLLRTSDETGSATPTVIAETPTGTLADYNSNRASAIVISPLGQTNTPQNQHLIDSLRRAALPLSVSAAAAANASPLSVYPVPAKESITVSFSTEHASPVKLVAIDALGRTTTLHEAYYAAGEHTTLCSTAILASGAYMLEIRTLGATQQRTFAITR